MKPQQILEVKKQRENMTDTFIESEKCKRKLKTTEAKIKKIKSSLETYNNRSPRYKKGVYGQLCCLHIDLRSCLELFKQKFCVLKLKTMQLANARKAAGAAVLLSLKSGGEKNVFRFQTEIFIRATFRHAFRQRFETIEILRG